MRRRDFIKPREKMKMIEPFGPNVVSSEGDLWRFHYRVTAPSFGNNTNYLVWDETRRQATLLKSPWARAGVRTLKSDVHAGASMSWLALALVADKTGNRTRRRYWATNCYYSTPCTELSPIPRYCSCFGMAPSQYL